LLDLCRRVWSCEAACRQPQPQPFIKSIPFIVTIGLSASDRRRHCTKEAATTRCRAARPGTGMGYSRLVGGEAARMFPLPARSIHDRSFFHTLSSASQDKKASREKASDVTHEAVLAKVSCASGRQPFVPIGLREMRREEETL